MKNTRIKILLPIIIVLLGILCFKNGVVVADRPELTHESVGILFFHIISLFSFGAKDYGAPVQGPIFYQMVLYMIYFIAPLISITALTEIIYLISKPIIPVYIFKKEFHVILGYGRTGKSAENAIKEKFGADARILIVDKHLSSSSLGIRLLFGWQKLLFNADLSEHFELDFINLSQCKSIFIITDNEWLNLKLFQLVSNDSNFQKETKVYTRINNLDIIEFLESDPTEGVTKNKYFFNIHSTSVQLFFQNKEVDKSLSEKHHLFEEWMREKIDTFIILGFGNFGQAFIHELSACDHFDACKTLIVVDNDAKILWESYLHDYGWESSINVQCINSNISNAANYDKIFTDAHPQNACAVFCSSDETLNLKAATSFHKMHKKDKSFKYIIRTTVNKSFSTELTQKCLGEHYIKIPTYDWTKYYFKENLN